MGTRRDDDVATSGIGLDRLTLLAAAEDRGSGELCEADLDGRVVLVRRLTAPDDERALAHAALLARQLVDLEAPDLVAVRAVRTGWDHLDLVLDLPDVACSLATLVTRRPLSPAETVGVGVGIARALGDLHDAGSTHGRLRAADVLVRPDGSVLLTGHGVAGISGSAGSAEGDVRDLVDLLCALFGDGTEEVADLDAGLAAGGESVAGLLDALGSVRHLPVPIRLPGRAPGLPLPRPGRRSWRSLVHTVRTGIAGLSPGRALAPVIPAAAGVLLLAGWIGASTPADEAGVTARGPSAVPSMAPPFPAPPSSAPPSSAPPSPAPPARAAQPPTDWRAVLRELDGSRGRAFATADEGSLNEVDAVGSSAHASDLAVVRALRARSAVAQDVRSEPVSAEVVSVEVVSAGTARADLDVVDVLGPHAIVTAPGGPEAQVLERREGRPERRLRYVLVRTDDGWRVAEVRAV